jgi:hypothetical protein
VGGLVSYVSVSEKRKPLFQFLVRGGVGSVHALAPLKTMFLLSLLCIAFNKEVFDRPNVGALFALEVILLGAVVGGFIFGAYWVLTGLLARMHTGDAFGALGIRNYKNFVRMKFEEKKLTIYPIGVAKLSSTKSCTKLCRKLPEFPPTEGSPEERMPLVPIKLPAARLIPNLKSKNSLLRRLLWGPRSKLEPLVISPQPRTSLRPGRAATPTSYKGLPNKSMNHWVAPRPKIDLALVGHAVRMMDMSVNGGENVGIVSRLAPRGGGL